MCSGPYASAVLLAGWLEFLSLESVGAAPAVETFPGGVQTGSIRQERPSNLSSQMHGEKLAATSLKKPLHT